MTYNDKLEQALHGVGEDDKINDIICFAYYAGQKKATKEICDKHAEIMKIVRKRARATRYHRMAEAILPPSDIIYSAAYAGDYTEVFKNKLWEEEQ